MLEFYREFESLSNKINDKQVLTSGNELVICDHDQYLYLVACIHLCSGNI